MTTTLPVEPASFGQYEVERLLGRGAMGTVYLARDRRIGRKVALKTIRITPDQFSDQDDADDFFKRLQREAEVCGSLHHPNIVTLYEAGYEDGRVSYLAMELVEGETLQAMMRRLKPEPLPTELALRIAEDVLRALAHAHAKGIIHRDIKPANILIAADGTAKLADFGIARPQDSSMTGDGALLGTPSYMPPEQIVGKGLTTRADLFSVGVLLYEMLTAVRPFAGDDLSAVLHNILRMEVASVSEVNAAVPRPVGDFVARLMAKSPEARPTAADAVQRIGSLRTAAFTDTLVLADTLPPSSRLRRRVRPLHAAVVIGLLLAFAAIPAAIIRTRTDSSPTVTIPQSQLDEFAAKRRALDEAGAAFAAGRYQESLQRYEAYLHQYPHSIAAQEGRDAAKLAVEQQKQGKPKPSQTRRRRSQDEDISPSELLRRLKKKVFRR